MKIKTRLLIALFCFTVAGNAEGGNISMPTLAAATRASFEDLKGLGSCQVQLLSQRITQQPDPEKYPLIGYGRTLEEAQARAALLCMKWRCETLPGEMTSTINEWKEMSGEKLMDYFNATGHLESFPAEVKADPEKFKEYVFKNNLTPKPSCETFNTYQLTLIYTMCSIGFEVVSDAKSCK